MKSNALTRFKMNQVLEILKQRADIRKIAAKTPRNSDIELGNEVKEAIQEVDVMNLRNSLGEIISNPDKEIGIAVLEKDVMDLRSNLKGIMSQG